MGVVDFFQFHFMKVTKSDALQKKICFGVTYLQRKKQSILFILKNSKLLSKKKKKKRKEFSDDYSFDICLLLNKRMK